MRPKFAGSGLFAAPIAGLIPEHRVFGSKFTKNDRFERKKRKFQVSRVRRCNKFAKKAHFWAKRARNASFLEIQDNLLRQRGRFIGENKLFCGRAEQIRARTRRIRAFCWVAKRDFEITAAIGPKRQARPAANQLATEKLGRKLPAKQNRLRRSPLIHRLSFSKTDRSLRPKQFWPETL